MKTVNVKLTDEMKKILGNSLGITVEAAFKYVPKAFRENNIPKEIWPVFTLTSKDGIEISELEDNIGEYVINKDTKTSSMKINSGSQRVQTLEMGIVNVKNFLLSDGTIISFDKTKEELKISGEVKREATVRDFIRYLSPALQLELQNAINERKVLTEEELVGLE